MLQKKISLIEIFFFSTSSKKSFCLIEAQLSPEQNVALNVLAYYEKCQASAFTAPSAPTTPQFHKQDKSASRGLILFCFPEFISMSLFLVFSLPSWLMERIWLSTESQNTLSKTPPIPCLDSDLSKPKFTPSACPVAKCGCQPRFQNPVR